MSPSRKAPCAIRAWIRYWAPSGSRLPRNAFSHSAGAHRRTAYTSPATRRRHRPTPWRPRQVAGYPNYDVFESSLAWLRERPSSIGLDPKERKIYQIEPTTNFTRMEFLPLGLMIVTVLGLGLGVWVVRRR